MPRHVFSRDETLRGLEKARETRREKANIRRAEKGLPPITAPIKPVVPPMRKTYQFDFDPSDYGQKEGTSKKGHNYNDVNYTMIVRNPQTGQLETRHGHIWSWGPNHLTRGAIISKQEDVKDPTGAIVAILYDGSPDWENEALAELVYNEDPGLISVGYEEIDPEPEPE